MKKSRKIKFFVIALVFVMFSMCFTNIVKAEKSEEEYYIVKTTSQFEFSIRELAKIYTGVSVGGEPKYPFLYDVTEEMVKDNTAVAIAHDSFRNSTIGSDDVSTLRAIVGFSYKDSDGIITEKVLNDLATKLNLKQSDIELRCTFYNPADLSTKMIVSTKTSTAEDAEKIESKLNEGVLRVDALLPDGVEYTLVLAGENYDAYNWYMVRTKEVEQPEKEFKTDITYTAIVDGNNVDGTKVDETFFPNYDRSKVEKDANVTANIVSTTKNDIVKINGVDLNPDGTKNELGWYYSNKEDKTVISKDYPFDTFDNIVDDGIVVEKDLELTSSDGLKDKETVSIEWPFRIIDVKQEPGEITEETEKVIVTITTNLPMEEEKLPEGWAFTTDEEGKTQHRIFKEFLKENGDKKEDVIVTANDRDDTNSIQVEVKWPAKPQAPEKLPDTGSSYVLIGVVVALVGCSAIIYRKIRK